MKRIRWKDKKRLKIKKSNLIILIIIGIILSIFFTMRFINMKVNPVLIDFAELESRKLASIVINNAISQNITQNIDVDELFLITRDNDGNIKTMDFNPITVNKILTQTTSSVQNNLKYIDKED